MFTDQEKTLAKLFAEKFIARRNIKAIQFPDGRYEPERPSDYRPTWTQDGFRLVDLVNHIRGAASYGHYMIGDDNTVKLFAFDVDLEKPDPDTPDKLFRLPTREDENGNWVDFEPGNPRELWMSRKPSIARNMLKYQMRMLAHSLVREITDTLEIPAVAAYSGSKGIHVYGFTGRTSAELARKGALLVLETIGTWQPAKGNNFFTYVSDKDRDDPVHNFEQFSLEIYPKQDKVTDLGNLMRLPLGRNLRSKDPTFFIDLRTRMTDMAPRDAIESLTTTNPWH